MAKNAASADGACPASNWITMCFIIVVVIAGLLGAAFDRPSYKTDAVLWLQTGAREVRIHVDSNNDEDAQKTIKSLRDYLSRFPGAKVQGEVPSK